LSITNEMRIAALQIIPSRKRRLRSQGSLSSVLHGRLTKASLLFLALSITGSSFAQTITALTLDQALDLTKQNSLKLRISDRDLERTTLARSELRASGFPQVSAKAGASYAPDSRHFGYDPAITDGGQLNGQLVVEQPVYDGGVRRLKMRQLGVDLEKLRAERELTERDLIVEVKQRFIELLQGQREQDMRQESVGQLQSYLDLVRSRNRGGAVPYSDVLKTQLDLSNENVAMERAHNSSLKAALALEAVMGVPADTSLVAAGSLDSLAVAHVDSILRAQPGDPRQNVELHNAALDVQRSELDVQLARRERRPMVDVIADAGYLSSRNNLTVSGGDRYSGLGFSAGISSTLSLFNGGATRLRIQQTEIARETLRIQRELLQRSIAGQVQSLGLQIQSQLRTLDIQQRTIEVAEQNYLLARSTYAGGGTTATEVLSAQQMLRDARFAELETFVEMAQLRLQLEQATTTYTVRQP
jgi:outer membrane protein